MDNNILTDHTSFNVVLDCTHNQMKLRLAEIKFDKRWNIAQVKEQLSRKFGSDPSTQSLQLHTPSGELICDMADDNKSLELYGAINGQCIHCIDSNT